MIIDSLKPLCVPIDSVTTDPRNARTHPDRNLKVIKKSLELYGQRKPIVVNKQTGIIEAGNATWVAAKSLKWTEIAATFVDDTPDKAAAYGIMDNRSAELAEYDMPTLKDILQDLDTGAGDLEELTGFNEKELEELVNQLHQPGEGLTDDDAIPEDVETICKTGDLWQLGNHRLLCGDSTKKEDVERLMGGEKADMVFTDPPYGIDIVKGVTAANGGSKAFGRVRQPGGRTLGVMGGDSGDGPQNLTGRVGEPGIVKPRLYYPVIGDDKPFEPAFLLDIAPKTILWGANNYSSKLPDSSGWLVWNKGIGDEATFSACELAWTNIIGHIKQYEYRWSGMIRAGSRKDELKDRVHPTQKPVGLFVQILQDFEAVITLDLFLGSGSTLIACEKLDRRCYGMEIDEHYCDVIIKRWQDYTGKKAVKQND